MSTEPHKLPDENATGVFEVPAPTPSPTESDLNSTGAFVLATGAVSHGNAIQDSAFDPTSILPPDENGATAVLPPTMSGTALFEEKKPEGKQVRPQPQVDPDATAELPPSALSGGDPGRGNDGTVEFGTAVYTPPDSNATGVFDNGSTDNGATGVYENDATRAQGQKNTLKREQANSDGTGVYEPGNTGKGGVDLGGATRFHDAANTDTGGTASAQGGADAGAHRCGKYVLKRFHAKGGMGEIWMAVDPAIGRSVALKRMLSHRADQQRRFRVEAQVTGQLEHPGIVPIHELGVNEEGHPFYTMKFVHGETLQKVIDDHHEVKPGAVTGEVAQFRLLQIFLSLCQTVAYAHSKGVLHRDLKPENVMLGPYGETLLLDWGIAKVMGQPEEAAGEAEYVRMVEESGKDSETRAGTIMGSLSYMSPEVAQGKNNEADQRSDVFLLGGILYAMLTGRPPRQGKNPMELIKQAQKQVPPAPRKFKPDLAKSLDAICMKALALRPEDRYQSALALAQDIQLYSAGEPVSAYREGFLTRAGRWARQHRKALTRTAMALLFVGLLVFGYIKYRQIEEQHAAEAAANQKRELELKQETERLAKLDQARRDIQKFRDKAEEARFYAATTDPVAEHAPYFDPKEAENKAKAALEVAATWGPTVAQLPPELENQVAPLQKDLYDLRLLIAQSKLQQETEPAAAAQEALALLTEAEPLRKPQPLSRGFYRLRSLAYQRLGDKEKADADQKLAVAENTPKTALDHFLLGEQYRKNSAGKAEADKGDKEPQAWQPDAKRMQEAITEYRLALADDPDHFWSYFQLGRCYLALGKFSEAVEALGACVALQPKSPWGYSVRGFALAQQQRYQEAEHDLDEAIRLKDDFRPSQLTRGVVRWLQKSNDLALADFDAVLQDPKEKRLLEAAYYRGQLYAQQQGKIQEALADFDLVVEEIPNFQPEVYKYRARLRLGLGQTEKALSDLTRYLQLRYGMSPKAEPWEAYGKRGHLLRIIYQQELPSGEAQKPSGRALVTLALAELNKALELGGKDPRLYDDLGVMLEQRGQAKEALLAYSKGLSYAAQDVLLLIKRGWLYAAFNQLDKALADFEAACRADPENGEAHSGLGYVHARQKAPLEALQEAELALLHAGEKYLVLHNVACIYGELSKSGDRQAAAQKEVTIALLKRAVQLWRRKGTGLNEVQAIRGESSFDHMKDLPAFIQLTDDHKAATVRWPWSLWSDLPAFQQLIDGDKP